MSYFRRINLSRELLIRAVGMAMLLAIIHRLQLLSEEKTPQENVSTPQVSTVQGSKPQGSAPQGSTQIPAPQIPLNYTVELKLPY